MNCQIIKNEESIYDEKFSLYMKLTKKELINKILSLERVNDLRFDDNRFREPDVIKCDVCKCHPSIIIRTSFGTFCENHVRYI